MERKLEKNHLNDDLVLPFISSFILVLCLNLNSLNKKSEETQVSNYPVVENRTASDFVFR